jgi:N-acyl-L-homoserine lactone synthetase
MLRDTFPALLDGQAAPASDAIWETSRFGVDLCTREAKTAGSIAIATYELFAGIIEFGLMRQLSDVGAGVGRFTQIEAMETEAA